jgi:hypothetical protein
MNTIRSRAMTDHAELVRRAEAAVRVPYAADLTLEHEQALDDFRVTWHPARALAALAVIEAAKDPNLDRMDEYGNAAKNRLAARVAAWNALNDEGGE